MAVNQDPVAKLGISKHDDGTLKLDGQSMLASLGGVWGVLESSVPGIAYAVVYALTNKVFVSVYAAGTLSLIFIIAQVVRKRPLAQAIYGLLGIGLAAYLTLRNGDDASHARDFFIPGLLTNVGYFACILLSIAIRWPIVGVLVGVFSSGVQWRKDKHLVRRYSLITMIWVALFGLRLLVEVPLYLANAVVLLGFVKLVMGVPLYALSAWFTWLAVKPLLARAE
jgi:hypothetical protein